MTTYENQENARSFSPAAQSVQRSSEGMSIAPPTFSLTSNSSIQREAEEEEPIQAKADIQRMGSGEEEEVQAKTDDIQRQTPMEEEEKKLG
jgi:hypothetical protein